MNDISARPKEPEPLRKRDPRAQALLRARKRAEVRFGWYGIVALAISVSFLVALISGIAVTGWPAFWSHSLVIDVPVSAAAADPQGNASPESLIKGDYQSIARAALAAAVPGVEGRVQKKQLNEMLSSGAADDLRDLVMANPGIVGTTIKTRLLLSDDADLLLKSRGTLAVRNSEAAVPAGDDNPKAAFLERLIGDGKVEKSFNWRFFTSGDSREPELAGIRGAVIGSVLTLFVTLGLCLPIGVLAAVYLEEFAPKNRLTDFIEININNLAAVPSIVFGLLGLAVFLNFFGLPRSAPLVGGLVLALLVLPTIIISARAALKSVPLSIREGALGIGASKQQAIFHHVLPLAMPGIMTGSIIGMAHALGETAPLLMIGMVAFIVDVPKSLTDAASVLPVQIYLWSDLPEAAFQSKTAAAIIVLLVILFAMNGAAIWLRKKFERRW
ncbi:MAG: phosphate ABC transporter permease PstA [Hyphomicrobium sp.]